MAIDDNSTSIWVAMAAAFGESTAVYTTKSGAALDISVIWVERGKTLNDRRTESTGSLMVQVSEIAEPEIHDEIEIDGATWQVTGVSGGRCAWKFDVTRAARPTLRGK